MSDLARKRPNYPAKPDRSTEFASYAPRQVNPAKFGQTARMATAQDTYLPSVAAPKTPERKSQAIRDSAKGEDCAVRIAGVCSGDPTHTIWSHAPLGAAGKGTRIKAVDEAGAYCCVECDAALDQATGRPAGMTRQQVLLDWMFGHLRSLVKLKQKGLI